MATATKAKADGLDELRATVKSLRREWDAAEADRAWFEKRYPSHDQARKLYGRRLAELGDQILAAENRLAEAERERA